MDGVNTIVMDLPYDIDGLCRLNADDSYTIIINARCSHEQQITAFEHEVEHIKRMDHYKTDVENIETEIRA